MSVLESSDRHVFGTAPLREDAYQRQQRELHERKQAMIAELEQVRAEVRGRHAKALEDELAAVEEDWNVRFRALHTNAGWQTPGPLHR
jgi:hypothetical protein